MSNKYVRAAMENSSKLPKTMEEFSQMHTSEAARVPVYHIQKLRKEHNEAKASAETPFQRKKISFD
jgi:hypothetical protein